MTRRYPGFDKGAGVYTHPVATAAIVCAASLASILLVSFVLLIVGVVHQ